MKRATILLPLLLAAGPALAQQSTTQPHQNEVQAGVEQQLGALMLANISLQAQVRALQAENEKLRAAEKAAPKADPSPTKP